MNASIALNEMGSKVPSERHFIDFHSAMFAYGRNADGDSSMGFRANFGNSTIFVTTSSTNVNAIHYTTALDIQSMAAKTNMLAFRLVLDSESPAATTGPVFGMPLLWSRPIQTTRKRTIEIQHHAAIELFRAWLEEAENEDPDEIRNLAELKRSLDADRPSRRKLFP